MIQAACALLLLTTLCIVLVILYGTRQLLILPRPPTRPTPDTLGLPYEAVSFMTVDAITLRGWFFSQPGAPVIIYCPGRGKGLNAFDFRYAPLFYHAGYQVLMFDWRGMGASEGRSSMGYWEQLDLKAAVVYLRQRGVTQKIGALGTSLGAAVVYLAAGSIPELSAVAGECGFATFEGMIADGMHVLYGLPLPVARPLAWLIARLAAWLQRFPLRAADPVCTIAAISPRPVFIIHGTQDRHVPVQSAYALYVAAREPKTLWTPPVAHTEALEKVEAEFRQRVLAFFDHWLKDEHH